MSFHIGQKVVCVDGTFSSFWKTWAHNLPRLGRVYTIRNYVPYWHFKDSGGPAVRLMEIIHPVEHWSGGECSEVPFAVFRFRPVVERKTGTGFAILEEIRQRESEPAPVKKHALSSTMGTKS